MKKIKNVFVLILILSGLSHPAQAVDAFSLQKLQQSLEISPEVFYQERNKIYQQFEKEDLKTALYRIRNLDKEFLNYYFLQITSLWLMLPQDHVAHNLRAFLVTKLNEKSFQMSWLQQQFYASSLEHDRGVTFIDENKVSLEVLSHNEAHLVLAHELSHLQDQDLVDARNNLSSMEITIHKLYQIPLDRWSETDRVFFGRFWFLKQSYLKYFKELKPRVNACAIYTDLVRNHLLQVSPNSIDYKRYAPVFMEQQSCYEFSLQEIRSLTGPPRFFWSENTEYGKIERQFLKNWLSEIQL